MSTPNPLYRGPWNELRNLCVKQYTDTLIKFGLPKKQTDLAVSAFTDGINTATRHLQEMNLIEIIDEVK